MYFPPLITGFPVNYGKLSGFWKGVEQAFGHSWKGFPDIPWPLNHLVFLIKNLANIYFACHVAQTYSQSNHTENSLDPDDKTSNSLNFSHLQLNDEQLQEVDDSVFNPEDDDPILNTDKQKSPKTQKATTKLVDLTEDPLSSLAGSNHQLDRKVRVLKAAVNDSRINGTAEVTPEELDKDSAILGIVHGLLAPSKRVINEISKTKRADLQDYLEVILKLEEEFKPLQVYASQFESISFKGHKLIQRAIQDIEKKTSKLNEEMAKYVRSKYRTVRSPTDGHCLFWSIRHQLKMKERPLYFRRLVASHIRKHAADYEIGVKDYMSLRQVKRAISIYQKKQGGKDNWSKKLAQSLGREPTFIDFYCDCLEKSSLWGGVNEIMALSEAFKIPVLLFTRQDGAKWRFDMKFGLSTSKCNSLMLLLYNGMNHYDSLSIRV